MAFSLQSEIDVANQSLGRIGSKATLTLAGYAAINEGAKAALHFPQVRDSLLRSFSWNFATNRFYLVSTWATATAYVIGQYVWYPDTSSTSTLYICLVAHTSGTFATDLAANDWIAYTTRPLYGYIYQYALPSGVLRLLKSSLNDHDFTLEGTFILTSQTNVKIKYISSVTDPDDWDMLFKEVFILKLALALLPAIGGVSTPTLRAEITNELRDAMLRARTVCANEVNTSGRSEWNLAKFTSGKAFVPHYNKKT